MNRLFVMLLNTLGLLARALMKYSLMLLVLCLPACDQKNVRPVSTQSILSPQKALSVEQQSTQFQAEMMAKIKQDKYLSAFLFSSYPEPPKLEGSTPAEPINPDPANVIATEAEAAPAETGSAPEVSHLVNVEVWNIILGQEKTALLKKAQMLGASQLPSESEWHQWKMAIGNIEGGSQKTIIFLAPPDFDKFKNGDHLIVEISSTGGVHMARYLKSE